MSPILRIHSPWFAQFHYPYQGFLIVWLILLSEVSGWDEVSATNVLDRVINLWIHGFSHASIWIEMYKSEQKKTTQKSKGLRKQL